VVRKNVLKDAARRTPKSASNLGHLYTLAPPTARAQADPAGAREAVPRFRRAKGVAWAGL